MSKFEVLCVTMHQKDFSKIEKMNVHSDIVFANQCDITKYDEYTFENHTAKMISTNTRGVGINRNLSLAYASGDICLFADDDVIYNDDMESIVLKEFENHPDADIIIFHLASDNEQRKQKKYSETRKCRKLERQPWGAVRIAFRLQSVKRANINFTSLFGGGCIFPAGEDSMWLSDARKAGLTFYVSKETIGKILFGESTWFTGHDEKYFYGRGAYYQAVRKHTIYLWMLYFAFRVRDGGLSFSERIEWMKKGKDGYDKMLSYDDYKSLIK